MNNKELKVYSAGTNPSAQVHPKAILVMKELGIDLSKNYPKSVDQFLSDSLFRKDRDEIKRDFFEFFKNKIKQ